MIRRSFPQAESGEGSEYLTSLDQGRSLQSDRLVQGPRSECRGYPRGCRRGQELRHSDCRQCWSGGGGLFGAGGRPRASLRARDDTEDHPLPDRIVRSRPPAPGRPHRRLWSRRAGLGTETGAFDLSTLREPYRIEGKKTLGLELAMQMGWSLPQAIIYPTGGGTGLIGMWKAFAELREAGWVTDPAPRMYSVQSTGCAPIVRAFESGEDRAQPWDNPWTLASGLRVPGPLGDRLILRALRESGGRAGAVRTRRSGRGGPRFPGRRDRSVPRGGRRAFGPAAPGRGGHLTRRPSDGLQYRGGVAVPRPADLPEA